MSSINHYWDAGVFVAYFNGEKGRVEIIEELLDEAEAGRVSIITSSFTLVEVIKLKGSKPLNKKDEKTLSEFFDHAYIRLVDATRDVCESARRLIWKYPALKPKDAVHLASALAFSKRAYLDAIFSYDGDFICLNGVLTNKFKIMEPYMKEPRLL